MTKRIVLVVPEAPAPAAADVAEQRKVAASGVRLGILDNSKGNADHLLEFVVQGLKKLLPVASVVSLRKSSVSLPAPPEFIDRLVAQTDFVVSAMAD